MTEEQLKAQEETLMSKIAKHIKDFIGDIGGSVQVPRMPEWAWRLKDHVDETRALAAESRTAEGKSRLRAMLNLLGDSTRALIRDERGSAALPKLAQVLPEWMRTAGTRLANIWHPSSNPGSSYMAKVAHDYVASFSPGVARMSTIPSEAKLAVMNVAERAGAAGAALTDSAQAKQVYEARETRSTGNLTGKLKENNNYV